MKRCKQCGELHDDSMYRPYYNGRTGRYKICLICEKVNTRFKYLNGKATLNTKEQEELSKIHRLYELQTERGLQPPGSRHTIPPLNLDNLLQKQQDSIDKELQFVVDDTIPEALKFWLTADLSPYTDKIGELQDVVAPSLLDEFRPQIGVDESFKPVYDETYRDVVNQILKRFDDFEDEGTL